MKFVKTSALILAGSALIVACSDSSYDTAGGGDGNALLAYVPADTPYVVANLEPVPGAIVDAYLMRFEPFLAEAQAGIDQAREEISMNGDQHDPAHVDLLSAVLDEFDGKINRAGLESLGFSMESEAAIYGNGIFPVVRIKLGDAQALRDTIARIEANSGQTIPEYQLNGQGYWRASEDDDDNEAAVYIAILDNHVAFSMAPMALEAEFLPAFLGQEMPANSLADSGALEQLNSDKGYLPYGSGYVDMALMLDELMNQDSLTVSFLSELDNYDPTEIDPVCKSEARTIAAFVPRMVAGVTDLTANSTGTDFQIELDESLAEELTRLLADVPPAASESDTVISAALGIEVGKLRHMMLDKANALAANPFKCERLADINLKMQEMALQLNQPMPPFIGNLKGFRAEFDAIDPTNPSPETVRGMFSLEVEKPQMLVGMATMMVPGFDQLELEPGGDPVLIPQELASIVTPEMELRAIMTSDAIGISMGPNYASSLLEFMQSDADNDEVFFSFEYDMAAMMALEQSASYEQYSEEGVSMDNSDHQESHDRLMEAYRNMVGRNRVEFRFVDDGLVISNQMNFK